MSCLFCKIIKKEVPSEIVYEDKDSLVFKDVRPAADIHLLLVPKKHIESIIELGDKDKEIAGKLLILAKKIARNQGIRGFKLVFNVGKEGGQLIYHLHMHLVAGNLYRWP